MKILKIKGIKQFNSNIDYYKFLYKNCLIKDLPTFTKDDESDSEVLPILFLENGKYEIPKNGVIYENIGNNKNYILNGNKLKQYEKSK